jgi:Flp pilus assembly protein TadD
MMVDSAGPQRILSRFVIVQVLLAIVAIGVSVFAGFKVAPLFREAKELEIKVKQQSSELETVKAQLSKEREALAAGRDAINAFHAGNYEEALNYYDRALTLDPQNAYILNLKGYVLFKMKRFSDAAQALNASIKVDPQYAWAYFDLARVQCAAGKLSEARSAIEKALSLRPELKETMANDGEFSRVCRPLQQIFMR